MERVAKKYARALLRTTGDSLENRSLYKEPFRVLRELFELKEASSLLYSRVMPSELKRDLLLYALEKVKYPQEFKSFILMLVDEKRVGLLPGLFAFYDEMLCEANGLVLGVVYSSCVLTAQELETIREKMEPLVGKKLSLRAELDKSLLGGMCLQYGNTQIDLSLKHKLDLLTAQVAQ